MQKMHHTFTIAILMITSHICTALAQKFPAILVFGDSTVDCGNNNHIPTVFRGDHQPYGRGFPGHVSTGRFSDGKLVPDMLASLIGLKETVPPSLEPNISDQEVLTGVSFASGGSGYDDLTTTLSNVIPLGKQIDYFKDHYIERVKGIVGLKQTQTILNTALVLISAGTNDFLFNFYDLPARRFQYTIDEYQNLLLNQLKHMVKELYELGCRRMLVSGLPPIGCLPIQITLKSPALRVCDDEENEESATYNKKLEKLLPQIEKELKGSRILYVDTYNPIMDMINNPQKYGFVEATKGCCGSGVVEIGPLCNEFSRMCEDSTQYIFYDSIHPTESTYTIVSKEIAKLVFSQL